MKMYYQHHRGMTLIEMLIVTAMLGILIIPIGRLVHHGEKRMALQEERSLIHAHAAGRIEALKAVPKAELAQRALRAAKPEPLPPPFTGSEETSVRFILAEELFRLRVEVTYTDRQGRKQTYELDGYRR